MIERKAKFIGAYRDTNQSNKHAWEHTELEYEYRGHKYFITKHNNGYMDATLRMQHEKEQKRIDELIENEGKPIPAWTYDGSAQQAFDELWEYITKGEYDVKDK